MNSVFREKIDQGDFGTDSVILGDSAYGPDYYVCKPFRNSARLTRAQMAYQKAQIQTRNTVERAIGVLKRRFPCLALGMHYRLAKIQDVIVSCCILHNMILQETEMNRTVPIVDDERNFQRGIGGQLLLAQQNEQGDIPLRTQDFLINNYFVARE